MQPTVELAKRNSRQRIDPLIEESPALRDKVKPARSRDAGNTMLSKEFAGGILIMTGANSAVGLRSTPARYIFLDEVDAYPASVDEEGDPVSLAEARSLTFAHRRKVFLASTPTIRGLSRIEREFEASDQAPVSSPARTAATLQWLKFERLRWENGKPETAAVCEGCDAPPRRARQDAHARGRRMAGDRVGRSLDHRLPPLGALLAGRVAAGSGIARGPGRAAQGSDEAIRAFRNTILGETWVETGEAPGLAAALRPAREPGPGHGAEGRAVPDRRVPTQKDRIEVDVWAGAGAGELARRSRRHRRRTGTPSWLGRLAALLGRTWPHAAARVCRSRDSPSTPATRRLRSMRGPGGRVRAGRAGQGRRGLQPGEPGVGPTRRRVTDGGRSASAAARALDRGGLDLQGRDLPLPAARPADGGGGRRRRIVPARIGASAGLGGVGMAEAVRGRAAGDGEDEARLRPAGMAEAPRAQRGARHPGLRPRRSLDRRRGPLVRRAGPISEAQLGAGSDDDADAPPAAARCGRPAGAANGAASDPATWGD